MNYSIKQAKAGRGRLRESGSGELSAQNRQIFHIFNCLLPLIALANQSACLPHPSPSTVLERNLTNR